ncbi:polycystin-1-like [Ptychodera flava]|uniref:polycystin-1-like n=1 Tax=Ptychodera flava TaxID=63121 RepID=UPI00396A175F
MEGISKCALLLSFVLLSTIYRVKTGCPKERFHMPMNEISDGYIVGNPALKIHGNVGVSSSLTGNGALLDESGAWLSTDFDNMACVGSPLHCPNGFTLSFWFQRRSPNTDAIVITNYDNLATSRGFRFEYQGNEVKWTLLSADDGKWSFSATAPSFSDWRHVTFVWDTVKTLVYVSGNYWGVFQRESGGHGVVVTDDFTSLVVGRDPSTGSNDPNFMIDDVRFAEEPLQQADIYLLAHLYDESNMKFFHWTMDSLSADNKTVEGYTPDVNIGIATRLYQEDIVPGVVDEAVELDGKIQRIVLKPGDDGCIEDMMYCDNGLTVAVWVYPSINASSKDTDMYILSRGGHRCSSNGFYFRLNANSSTGPQNIFEVGVTVETDKWSFVFAMETNKWSHVAFTWSIMTGLKVYIDGGCVGTDTEGTPRPYWEPAEETEPYPDFYVGQANDRFAPTYGMFKVDDLMFWDDLIDIESITSIYYEGYIDSHYIGCYREDMGSPEFSVLPTYIQAITPVTCRYSCRFDNYLFASLRNGNQCFCGNDVGSNTQLTDSECDIQCLNDTSTFCGGSDKNAVFDTSHFMYVQESQTATEAVTGVTLSADLIYKANSISATVTKTSGDAVLYYYDFGDSSGVLEWRFPTIEYQYAESGNYTLTVMVKNQINNESAVYEIAVVIAIRDLRLSLDTAGYAENVTGGVDMEMTFQMKVSFGSKITFEFDFGDGAIESDYKSKGKEYTVTHTYTDIGEYTLTGTAENLVGFEGLTRTVIIIYPVKGLEFTQFNDTLRSPDDAFFLLSLQDGIHPPDDMTLEVDFGDDSSIFTVSNAQISTETPILLTHRYNTAGTYTVFVNCFNLVNSMVFTAEMPVVNLVDAVIVSTSTTLADIGNCTDINATVINGTHITVQIDFGDGENAYTSLMVAGVVIFTHCWEVTGSFIPNVTAHNVYSSITSALADPIIVQEDAYHLVLNSDSPVIIDEDLVTATFQLDALPGFGPPSAPSLEWNFGDGTSLQAEDIALEQTNVFLHNYTSIGTYYVILNVWNLVSSARYSTVVEIYEDVRIIGLIVGFWPTNDSHQMAYGPFKNHVPLSNVTQFTANVFSGSNLTYSWQFGDGTIGSGNTTSHIYANAGTYTVRLVVENAVNSQTKQRTVYLIEPIPETLQLTATNYEPMVNEVVNFTVNLGNSYLHACTVWDFHDGSAKLVVGPYYCMQRSDYSSYDKQDGYGNQLQCQHSFGRGGMQMVTVIADNYLSNPSVSVMINVDGLPCNAPIVKIKDGGEIFQNPRTEKRSKTVVIRSLVTLDCMTTSLTNFSWSLYRTDNFGNEMNLSAQDNGTELVIPAKSQPLGFYKIILTVSMLGVYNTETESTSYLQLIATPLTVRIVGGSGRPVGYGTVLNLDALTLTFDPDAESPDDKSDLEFMWFCRQSVEDFPMTGNYLDETLPTHEPGVDNGGCFGHGSGRIDYHDGVLRIDTELMDSNTTYVFKVIVMEKDRRGEFDQEIKLVDGIPPVIDISCKTNCGGKVNPTGTLSYQGECTNCLNGVKLSYQWSLYVRNETDGNYNSVHNFQDYTSTGIEKTGISFIPNSLQAGRKYRLGLYGSRQGYVTGYSFLYFITNLPPFDGVCQISPTTGTAIQTEYIVSCENWVDEGDDVVRSEGSLKSDHLNYRILYGKKDESMSQIYHGSDPSENNLIFAAGPADSDYRYDVIVHIIDNHGAYAEFELSVQVTEMEISPGDSDLLVEQLVTGENSKLEQLMQAGDFQGATQLIMALMSLYPDDGQVHLVLLNIPS